MRKNPRFDDKSLEEKEKQAPREKEFVKMQSGMGVMRPQTKKQPG